jgi:hypothetical protein
MASTYEALFGNAGVALATSVMIEGVEYAFTDAKDLSAMFSAYDNSDTYGGREVCGGLAGIAWDIEQRAAPYKPFGEPAIIKISIVPSACSDGNDYDLGAVVFRRVGGDESHLSQPIDCDDTTIVVQRATDFAPSGDIYIGTERIRYQDNDGSQTFSECFRGLYAPFVTSGGASFSRPHRPTTTTTPAMDVSLQPLVTELPRAWIGKWVGVWLHQFDGSAYHSPNVDQSAAHLAFAGQIVAVEDVDGQTVLTVEDLRRKMYETVIMREPFRARVKEGCRLNVGMTFSVKTTRQVSGGGTTVGTGSNLVVVSGAPANPQEVQAGFYTAQELADNVLTRWLQDEKNDGRILFNCRVDAMYPVNGNIRTRITYNDPTTTSGLNRTIKITSSAPLYLQFLGFSSGAVNDNTATADGEAIGDRPPLRAILQGNNVSLTNSVMTLEQPRGSWVTQMTLLPQQLRDPNGLIDGVLRIGGLGYVRAGRVSDTSFRYNCTGLESFFPGNANNFQSNAGSAIFVTVEDDLSLEVEQVLILKSPFKTLLLKILLSTGTGGFNHATYDDLTEQISCGIPYQLLGDDFVAEVENLDFADIELTAIVRKSTRFIELFDADFILRRIFPVWGRGRLRIGAWASANSGFASFTLDETTKATPSGTHDNQRAQVTEDDSFYNVVKIYYSPDADGELQDHVTLVDAGSVRDHGERSITINARNTFRQAGAIGNNLDDLIAWFSGFFPYTSRPWQVIRRSIDFNRFEAALPGTVLAITDKYVRDPATGLRYDHTTGTGGLQGYPGMVLWNRYDWGGVEAGRDGGRPTIRPAAGEVDIMISPQRTQATYVPTAQVDETAANAGYNAGTKTLTTYAHKYTEASESNDNTFFAAGDKVLVHEIDPSVAASPLSWSDTIVSTGTNTIVLTTGLAGWDTAKRYRVIYDAYGTVTSTQKTKCYQADDSDGMIVNTAQPYGFGFFPLSQGNTPPTAVDATVAPARHATLAYGDGKPLDVGFDTGACRLANNLLNYKTSPQAPTQYASAELRDYPIAATGSYKLVEIQPIYAGIQWLGAQTRDFSVAPRIRSSDGTSITCRIRLCKLRPTGSTLYDVNFIDPYASVSFTTSSTTFAVPTAQTLNINHLKLSDASNGGWGWITVEITVKGEYSGLSRWKLGALSG